MYRIVRLCICMVSVLCALSAVARTKTSGAQDRPYTIVIDAGHGGRDYGCVGALTNEKTIVLDVSRRLGEIINRHHPEIKVVYTRDDDRYLTLQERANVANNARGDLFVSIHVNSVDKRSRNRASVHGASVYTLGLHKSDNNLNVAMRENAVMELEQDYSAKYQGFDPTSSESYIMFELNQNSHVSNSLELASLMQGELISTAGRADKNVRQAGFWVLWAVAMPSVLVELDFICNPAMEKFLNGESGRKKCAEALANAIEVYYKHHRREGGEAASKAVRDAGSASPLPVEAAVEDTPADAESAGEPTFHIQVLASPRRLEPNHRDIARLKNVGFYREGKLYKYYSGTYTTFNEARKALPEVRRTHPEAFIVKLVDGKRI